MRFTILIFTEILLLLVLASGYIPDVLSLPDQQSQALEIVVNFFFFAVAIDLIRRCLIWLYARKNNQAYSVKDNFQFGINNIAKFILGLGIIVTIFAIFGIDFKSLLTSLSIVAAAIAIILKEYINDFIVGLYYSFSKDIEINDYIKVDNVKGKIIEIQMLKIKILNDDDDLIIIPNSKIYNNEIINYTKRDIRSLSVDFQIAINAIKNIELLEQELIASIANFSDYLEPNSFYLKIVEMKKDSMNLKFQYTIKNIDRDLQKQIRRKTVRQVFNYISERSI